jgi:hypothetical protein
VERIGFVSRRSFQSLGAEEALILRLRAKQKG